MSDINESMPFNKPLLAGKLLNNEEYNVPGGSPPMVTQ
jgi:hypothetical protein